MTKTLVLATKSPACCPLSLLLSHTLAAESIPWSNAQCRPFTRIRGPFFGVIAGNSALSHAHADAEEASS